MNTIKNIFLATAMLGIASTVSAGPLSYSYSDLFVFGDSIVDTGNTQLLTLGATGGTLDPTPAAAGYFGGRFTNGVNPADVVNQAIEGTNLTGSLLGGDNYSFGGARARDNGDAIPDLMVQVQGYLNDVLGVVDEDALHLINVGGNDIRDILIDGLDPNATIAAATTTIVSQIIGLQTAGARELLFVGVGDVGAIPEVQALEAIFPGVIATGRLLSELLNASIEAALTPIGVDFYDTIGFFDDLLPTLALEGINTSVACLDVAGVADPLGAPTCDGYAFFDRVHPSTQSLQLLGNDIVASLVSTPATLALFSLGLAGLGWSRRKSA